jgi:hypothetical protein
MEKEHHHRPMPSSTSISTARSWAAWAASRGRTTTKGLIRMGKKVGPGALGSLRHWTCERKGGPPLPSFLLGNKGATALVRDPHAQVFSQADAG